MNFAYVGTPVLAFDSGTTYWISVYGKYKWGEKRFGTFRFSSGTITNIVSESFDSFSFNSEGIPSMVVSTETKPQTTFTQEGKPKQ